MSFFDYVLATTVQELHTHKSTIDSYGQDVSNVLGSSNGYDPSGREQVSVFVRKFVQELICHLSDISGHPEIPENLDLPITPEVKEVMQNAASLLSVGSNLFRRRD